MDFTTFSTGETQNSVLVSLLDLCGNRLNGMHHVLRCCPIPQCAVAYQRPKAFVLRARLSDIYETALLLACSRAQKRAVQMWKIPPGC